MPFLTIYTPTYKRPSYLKRCVESVQGQTVYPIAIQHIIVEDTVGVGVAGMYAEIANHVDEMKGDYVYILQDDDILAADDVVERLMIFVETRDLPGVVICRNTKRGVKLPVIWRSEPVKGWIDLGNYVTRIDIFAGNVHAFGKEYAGDYPFIRKLWEDGIRFAWLDMLLAQAQATGEGKPESELEHTGVKFESRRMV